MLQILAISIGGALGAVSRFYVSQSVNDWALSWGESRIPWGTVSVNVAGSLLLGLMFVVFAEKVQLAEEWRSLVSIGLLGSFTTFSTYSLEALLLIDKGQYALAASYASGSVILCLVACYAGMQAGRALF